MPYLVLGACLLIGFFLIGRWFVDADPKQVARAVKYGGIGLGGAIVLFLLVTGRWSTVIGLVLFLWPLVRGWRVLSNRARAANGPSSRQASTLQTAWLSVELDHDTGEVSGIVRRGRFQDRALDTLSIAELRELAAECQADGDGQSVAILEAYLDRRDPDWRDAAGPGAGRDEQARRGGPQRMSRDEALRVLGLPPDATTAQIKDAHRRLMLKLHPDQGGSDYLAAKLNEAKDVLLG